MKICEGVITLVMNRVTQLKAKAHKKEQQRTANTPHQLLLGQPQAV